MYRCQSPHLAVIVGFLVAMLLCQYAIAGTGRSLSLQVLQTRMRQCAGSGACPRALTRCAGITHVVGYAVDKDRRDIVLIGKAVDGDPPLLFEDFVVALRNVSLHYAHRRANKTFYSAPTVSIDPEQHTLKQLARIAEEISHRHSEDQLNALIEQWHAACRAPQKITVMGVPENTRFAEVMVQADYGLKAIVDGTIPMGIPGFLSHAEMILKEAKAQYLHGGGARLPFLMVNRFWLYPGDIQFVERNNALMIKKCGIQLLTEREFVEKNGRRRSTHQVDSLALRFAREFSARYEEVVERRPIYGELRNLFRFVFLAKAMVFKDVFAQVGLDPGYLLEEYPVREREQSTAVPGCSRFVRTRCRRPVHGGYKVAHFRLPCCGGIHIEPKVDKKVFVKDTTGVVKKVRKKALEARPAADSLSWDFEIDWED